MPTTINDELTRIEGAKADIATAIGGKGVTVPANAKIDDFADLIDAIQASDEDTIKGLINGRLSGDFVIPEGITSIRAQCFAYFTNLQSITIPDSVTTIGSQAFRATPLRKVNSTTNGVFNLPNYLTSLEENVFSDNSYVNSVTIPSTVSNIKGAAFIRCPNLVSVTILRTTPPSLTVKAFGNNSASRKFYVPAESVETYKTASGWSSYASVIEAIQN